MNFVCVSVALAMVAGARAESLLTAQSFPKTFNDIPFIDRMKILADDYADYDPEYDENGRCIRGCAYQGIRLEDELAAIERQTRAAQRQLELYKLNHPDEFQEPSITTTPPVNPPVTLPVNPPVTPPVNPPVTPPVNPPVTPPVNPPSNTVVRQCAVYSNTIRPMDAVIQSPIDGALTITSDFGTRAKPCARCSSQHRGIDLSAGIGTNVYATANGTVVSITNASSACGNGVVIDHADGYRTTYCHFSQVTVKVGERVQGGCLIGKSGNTGASTGPHLHYAIKFNGTWIDPLYPDNRLGREYRFKQGLSPSKEHAGKILPGKTN